MTFEFENANELIAKLEDLASNANLKSAVMKGCLVIEGAAREKAPKATGELRRSITSEVKINGDMVEGVVYTPLEYAPYVEYGTGLFAENGDGRKDVPWVYQDDAGEWHTTSGQAPQPFMRPAFKENREKAIRVIQKELFK